MAGAGGGTVLGHVELGVGRQARPRVLHLLVHVSKWKSCCDDDDGDGIVGGRGAAHVIQDDQPFERAIVRR